MSPAIGDALTSPPPEFSTRTAIATCGSSYGAKPMNQECGVLPGLQLGRARLAGDGQPAHRGAGREHPAEVAAHREAHRRRRSPAAMPGATTRARSTCGLIGRRAGLAGRLQHEVRLHQRRRRSRSSPRRGPSAAASRASRPGRSAAFASSTRSVKPPPSEPPPLVTCEAAVGQVERDRGAEAQAGRPVGERVAAGANAGLGEPDVAGRPRSASREVERAGRRSAGGGRRGPGSRR